jgi:hypothetical protein
LPFVHNGGLANEVMALEYGVGSIGWMGTALIAVLVVGPPLLS